MGAEPRIQAGTKLVDDLGQWVTQVLVLTHAEVVLRHDHTLAKAVLVIVKIRER